jgi:FkbM family methyltransferase
VKRHRVFPRGIVHIGAHEGEEADVYGQLPVTWIEANPDLIDPLRRKLRRYRTHRVIEAAVSDREGQAPFHLASNGQSSSLLALGTHATEHPDVIYTGERTLTTTTLDALVAEHNIKADLLVMDVQGAELMAMKGGERFLSGCVAVYAEVNTRPVYEGCPLLPEMMGWLDERGFELRELMMTCHGWGDALWVRTWSDRRRERASEHR